jgi:hypothetical protein
MPRAKKMKDVDKVIDSALLKAQDHVREGMPETPNAFVEPEFDYDSSWNAQLTPKQLQYVQARAGGMSPSKASEFAYDGNSAMARTNEANSAVQAALRQLRGTCMRRMDVTRDSVAQFFLEAIEMGRVLSEPMTIIAGARELGKMYGLFEPSKTELVITGPSGELLHKLNTLTDEQLLKLAAESDEANNIIDVTPENPDA